ncbi:PEP-CTERM sorting domain-containing protein [Schlegelella sp. S2-27]|uniref:PEP-CTERM sorting domain-containing protein n=1 Tax=Caldimonas mangrovi TaxID=2944811 RepID=A0ABT0YUU2_9BURK|nr:PEP-CTERM sorting domain-containing protein [Caldimonas mangrovi]MCM5682378.1 PEP-CTERM sorting domain-containing protein [Caldimonas mangrovi]
MSHATSNALGSRSSSFTRRSAAPQGSPAQWPRLRSTAAALAVGLTSTCAGALTTTWAGIGIAPPYWDLDANWSAGAPIAPDTEVQLGHADTVLRSGSFQAARVQGLARLEISGGRLQLHGEGSSLNSLHLSGGELAGPGSLTVSHLRWTGGAIGGTGTAPRITAAGGATLSGNSTHVMAAGGSLTLGAYSFWIANDWHMFSPLSIQKNVTFIDRPTATGHELRLHADAEFAGLYRKEAGNTRVRVGQHASFRNSGAMVVESGSLDFQGGKSWDNTGALIVTRTGRVDLFRSTETRWSNTGRVQVEGLFRARVSRLGMSSSGTWFVAKGGQATFVGDRTAPVIVFEQGVHNEGGLALTAGFDPTTSRAPSAWYRMEGGGLTGTGSVWVDRAHLDLGDEHVNHGRLTINSGEVRVGHYVQNEAAASTGVGRLLTADDVLILGGTLHTAGYDRGIIDGNLVLGDDATFEARSGWYQTSRLDVTGTAALDGTLLLDTYAPMRPGSHRLLQAAGGITGSFDELVSDVDVERYLLTLTYGSDWVALNVTAVPEPHTYALMAAGIVALVVRTRRRRSTPADERPNDR